MKRFMFLGVIFILLAVLVVPAMAKSPFGNNHPGNSGNGSTPVASSGDQNNDSSHGQGGQQNQNGNGNHGEKGKGNGGQGNPNKSPMGNPFYLQGTIKSIDTTNKTITVTVVRGNARVKQFIGTDIILKITDTTQLFKINQMDENGPETDESSTSPQSSSAMTTDDNETSNRVVITFEQLAVGDIVAVHGNLVDNVYTARLVTVYVRAPEGEPGGEPEG